MASNQNITHTTNVSPKELYHQPFHRESTEVYLGVNKKEDRSVYGSDPETERDVLTTHQAQPKFETTFKQKRRVRLEERHRFIRKA